MLARSTLNMVGRTNRLLYYAKPQALQPTAWKHDHAGCSHNCDHSDTVVARCTKRINDLLSPLKVAVSSTNDDPNGSHVGFAKNIIEAVFIYLLL